MNYKNLCKKGVRARNQKKNSENDNHDIMRMKTTSYNNEIK